MSTRAKFRRVWKAIKKRPVPEIKYYSRAFGVADAPYLEGCADVPGYATPASNYRPCMFLEMGHGIKQQASANAAPYSGNPTPDPTAAYIDGDEIFCKTWTIRFLLNSGVLIDGLLGNGHVKFCMFTVNEDTDSLITEKLDNAHYLVANAAAVQLRSVFDISPQDSFTAGASATESYNTAGFWPRLKVSDTFQQYFTMRRIWEFPKDFPRLNAATQWIRSDVGGNMRTMTTHIPMTFKIRVRRKKTFIQIDESGAGAYGGHLYPRLFFAAYAPNFNAGTSNPWITNDFDAGASAVYDTLSFTDN